MELFILTWNSYDFGLGESFLKALEALQEKGRKIWRLFQSEHMAQHQTCGPASPVEQAKNAVQKMVDDA